MQVTGVLADALNWGAAEGETYGVAMKKNIDFTKLSETELGKLTKAQQEEYKTREAQYNAIEEYNKMVGEATSAEDYFNIALSNLSTEEERQAFIIETLSGLYGGAADTYRETEGAMMEAKDAAAEQILAENNLASAIEPVTTAWQSMKNELLVGIIPAVEKVSEWAIGALEWMREHPKLMQFIGITLGIVTGALTALAIGWGIYTAAQWLANAAILGCPLTWIVVAIVAVAAAIAALIVYWDEITAAVSNAAQAIWKAIKSAWDWIVNLFSSIGSWIYDNVIEPVVNFFKGMWDGIKNVFGAIGGWFKEKFTQAKENATQAWANTKEAFGKIWGGIKNVFSNVGGWFKEKFTNGKENAASAWSNAKSKFSGVWSNVKGAFSNVGGWFKDQFSKSRDNAVNAWSNAKSKFSGVWSKIKGVFSGGIKLPKIKMPHFSIKPKGWKIGDLMKGSIPKLGIEWYAKGGILKKPTIFGMNGNNLMVGGEAGAEAIIPLDRLQTFIDTAVDRALQANNLQALAVAVEDLANRPIELHINGRQFATATASDADSVNGNRLMLSRLGLALG